MFYIDEVYFNEIEEHLDNISQYIECINKNIDRKDITGKIESDLRMNLIIKSTGVFENLFSDIILKFAIANSSQIFHDYFTNNFKNAGKNVSPEGINNLLKNINIDPVKRNENIAAYESLKSLYDLRNKLSHGDLQFAESLEQITAYINNSVDFMRLVIEHMDEHI
mgnify:CR=1 FL=1